MTEPIERSRQATDANRLGDFFDALSTCYTESIERCFPRYREMLWALLDYLPDNRPFNSILELGCGTGSLSVLLSQRFPSATFDLVDVSAESLRVCRDRLGDDPRFVYVQHDFRDLKYTAGAFDLVISSISIHHLTSAEKRTLFSNLHDWLTPRGVFAYADQFRGATDQLYARHVQNWKRDSLAAGGNEDEFEMWMAHQREYDHHDTLADQLAWLSEAGFATVDCTWRYLLWSVIQARRATAVE